MAMMKCPECGKEISDLASSCPHCGFPIGFESTTNNHSYSEQSNNQYQNALNAVPINTYQQPEKKDNKNKNSTLGIWALIFSILGCTFIIGIVLAVIDLLKKDGRKKVCSIIALCICGFWLIVGIAGTSNTNNSKQASNAVQNTNSTNLQKETENNEPPQEEASNKAETEQNEKSDNSAKTSSPKISKEDFISTCEEISYKTLARNPEDYVGKRIVLTVKVSQIVQGGLFDDGEYYRVYTNDEYNMWLGDEYFMSDYRDEKDMKILVDDILVVYAEFDGTRQVERAFTGTKEDVLSIKAIYIELIEEDAYSIKSKTEIDDSEYENMTTGQKNALNQALSYLSFSAFSYQGLIEQLEYEKYTHEDAVFAADNCGADWNEQAAKKAESYLEFSSFSKEGLIEQLEYEGFTHEQAVYGAEQNGY